MASLFEIQDLSFRYALDAQWVVALDGINGKIESEKITCLTGPSGSGKSTLLNLLGLIEPLQTGSIKLFGADYGQMSESEKNRIRRFDLGFIFQTFHLFPILNARENVEYFLHKQKLSSEEIRVRSEEALRAVDLFEHATKRPLEMSGGQRQRVAIARALAKRPKLIIADEPTASLDQKTGRVIMQILKNLNHEQKISVVVSSHDPMVLDFSDTQVKLRDGMMVG